MFFLKVMACRRVLLQSQSKSLCFYHPCEKRFSSAMLQQTPQQGQRLWHAMCPSPGQKREVESWTLYLNIKSHYYNNMVVVLFSSCLASQLCPFFRDSEVVYQNNFLMFLKLARSSGYCCDVVKGKSSWFSQSSAAPVLCNAPLIAHQGAVVCPSAAGSSRWDRLVWFGSG